MMIKRKNLGKNVQQNKEEQQLKLLNELVVFISAKFDEFQADQKN